MVHVGLPAERRPRYWRDLDLDLLPGLVVAVEWGGQGIEAGGGPVHVVIQRTLRQAAGGENIAVLNPR